MAIFSCSGVSDTTSRGPGLPREPESKSLPRALPNFRRVCAKERRGGGQFAVDHREMHADVVALNPVAPDALLRRLPENAEEIPFRVAPLAAVAFDHPEHLFQAHDGRGFDIAAPAETRAQQGARKVFLRAASFPPASGLDEDVRNAARRPGKDVVPEEFVLRLPSTRAALARCPGRTMR